MFNALNKPLKGLVQKAFLVFLRHLGNKCIICGSMGGFMWWLLG